MCDPVSATIAGLAVFGGYTQIKGANAAQKSNNKIADANAGYADMQAVDAERQGVLAGNESRMKTRQTMASQVVGFAAQNVDSSTGTPLDIIGDTAMFGQIDIDRIRANAQREAYGHRVDAWNIRAGNKIERYQTKLGNVGTALTTASKVVGAYGTYKAGQPAKPTTTRTTGSSFSLPVSNYGSYSGRGQER